MVLAAAEVVVGTRCGERKGERFPLSVHLSIDLSVFLARLSGGDGVEDIVSICPSHFRPDGNLERSRVELEHFYCY